MDKKARIIVGVIMIITGIGMGCLMLANYKEFSSGWYWLIFSILFIAFGILQFIIARKVSEDVKNK